MVHWRKPHEIMEWVYPSPQLLQQYCSQDCYLYRTAHYIYISKRWILILYMFVNIFVSDLTRKRWIVRTHLWTRHLARISLLFVSFKYVRDPFKPKDKTINTEMKQPALTTSFIYEAASTNQKDAIMKTLYVFLRKKRQITVRLIACIFGCICSARILCHNKKDSL